MNCLGVLFYGLFVYIYKVSLPLFKVSTKIIYCKFLQTYSGNGKPENGFTEYTKIITFAKVWNPR